MSFESSVLMAYKLADTRTVESKYSKLIHSRSYMGYLAQLQL